MSNGQEFQGFPKIARLSRECIITEKLDGTNAQIFIWGSEVVLSDGTKAGPRPDNIPWLWTWHGGCGIWSIAAGSRTRWITEVDDNHGFAKWVIENVGDSGLFALGHGRHFGEWWGSGINRGYGLSKKRFSLFNVTRWCLFGQKPKRIPTADPRIEKWQEALPACCRLVPVLYRGVFQTQACEQALHILRENGSVAAPGFKNPEGIVCFHTAANVGFKKTLEKDEVPKGKL